ncbi:MAG: Iron-sulfur cluster regulator IscR, partial [uncultured Craurococcus sp.]
GVEALETDRLCRGRHGPARAGRRLAGRPGADRAGPRAGHRHRRADRRQGAQDIGPGGAGGRAAGRPRRLPADPAARRGAALRGDRRRRWSDRPHGLRRWRAGAVRGAEHLRRPRPLGPGQRRHPPGLVRHHPRRSGRPRALRLGPRIRSARRRV